MENNIIYEITRIKNLILINESIIKFKIGDAIQPKIIDNLRNLGDDKIKSWNIELIKKNRRGAEITTKLDTKAKLLDKLNNIKESDIRYLNSTDKKFLTDLNNRLDDIDANYIKDLGETFKNDYKLADDLSRGQFLNAYKEIMDDARYPKFEEAVTGKKPVDDNKPSNKKGKNWLNYFSKNKKGAVNSFWGLLGKIIGLGSGAATSILIYLFVKNEFKSELPNLIETLKSFTSEKGITSLTGKDLFLKLLTYEKSVSGTAADYAKSVGLLDGNIANADADVNDVISEESGISNLSEDELGEFLNRITTSYDGVNFIYFLKKFKEVKNKDFYTWIMSDINGSDGADFTSEEFTTALEKINPNFTFITGVSYKTTADNINQILTIYQNVTSEDTGIKNIYYRNNGTGNNDKTEPWKKFTATSGSTLDITDINNKTVSFSYDEINNIKESALNYLNEYWASMAQSNKLDELLKKGEKTIGVESNEISKTLDESKMYEYVYDKLEDSYPKIANIRIDWKNEISQNNWPIQESLKGLSKILSELKKKETVTEVKGNSGGGGGGSSTTTTRTVNFPGPGTTQQFQDWLDTTYPTWLNGGKLNKGTGYGSYGPSTQKAFSQYGTQYQQSLTSGSGTPTPQPTVDKEKEIFDKFNDSISFRSMNNEPMNIEYRPEIAKKIKYLKGLKFNDECSYLGAILALYGKIISKYKTDINTQNNIDTHLPSLQKYLQSINESLQIKRPNGLAQILEQVSDFVTVYIDNGVPRKKTEDDEYKDMSSVTIKSIIGGGTELRKGDRSGTVQSIKNALKYTKDTTVYFTDDFNKFLINYKGTHNLDNSNGNIDQDLICSIDQYKQLCATYAAKKTTAPTEQKQLPVEVKYLNDYATAVGTGTPSEGPCKSLFDYYAKQAKDWDLGNKAGNPNTQITDELLKNVKTAVKRCKIGLKKNFYPSDRKYITDKNNPFYIVDFDKEAQKPATTPKPTTPTVATNNTPNPVDTETEY